MNTKINPVLLLLKGVFKHVISEIKTGLHFPLDNIKHYMCLCGLEFALICFKAGSHNTSRVCTFQAAAILAP